MIPRKLFFMNKELLENYYIIQKLTCTQIAEKLDCNRISVYNYLKLYNIPIRSNSEAHIGINKGENHPNWKGGFYRDRLNNRKLMSENKKCSSYLGVYIAERALSKFFDHIIRMPYGNPGFDYICGKGFKIDVKSSCRHISKYGEYWTFCVDKNKIADYFLCLALNNRESLDPIHIWLILGWVVNNNILFQISDKPESLSKWLVYEKSLDKVIDCCTKMA